MVKTKIVTFRLSSERYEMLLASARSNRITTTDLLEDLLDSYFGFQPRFLKIKNNILEASQNNVLQDKTDTEAIKSTPLPENTEKKWVEVKRCEYPFCRASADLEVVIKEKDEDDAFKLVKTSLCKIHITQAKKMGVLQE